MKYKDPEPKPLFERIINAAVGLIALALPIMVSNYFENKGAALTETDRYMVAAIWYILVGFCYWWFSGKTFKEKKPWQPRDED